MQRAWPPVNDPSVRAQSPMLIELVFVLDRSTRLWTSGVLVLRFCGHVDGFREFGQGLVRVAFLIQRLLKHLRVIVMAQQLRPGSNRAVAGHLAVLDVLSGGNQSGIEHIGVGALLDESGALLEEGPRG